MQKLKSLSVFFPVYNEEANLDILLKQALEILPKVARRFEILVINDGSNDNSEKVAQRFVKKHPQIRLISHERNLGYGEVLKTGIKESQYEWIFWMDSDLQFDLNEIAFFVQNSHKSKVIIGYRSKRAEGFRRHLNTSIFRLYINLLFRLHVRDIDCAFKLIRASELKSLKLLSGSAFTSAEILYRLKKRRLKFQEIPVQHYKRLYGQATGANWRVIIKACVESLKIYLNMKFSFLK